jgi:hypothetical protein
VTAHYPTGCARSLKLALFPDRTATMPSFDVVSEVDKHELTNAVDQATRELASRFSRAPTRNSSWTSS